MGAIKFWRRATCEDKCQYGDIADRQQRMTTHPLEQKENGAKIFWTLAKRPWGPCMYSSLMILYREFYLWKCVCLCNFHCANTTSFHEPKKCSKSEPLSLLSSFLVICSLILCVLLSGSKGNKWSWRPLAAKIFSSPIGTSPWPAFWWDYIWRNRRLSSLHVSVEGHTPQDSMWLKGPGSWAKHLMIA